MCIVASGSGPASQNVLLTLLTKLSLQVKTFNKYHLVIPTPNIPSLTITHHLSPISHVEYFIFNNITQRRHMGLGISLNSESVHNLAQAHTKIMSLQFFLSGMTLTFQRLYIGLHKNLFWKPSRVDLSTYNTSLILAFLM